MFEIQNSPNIGRRRPAHDNPIAVWSEPNPCGYAQLLKLTTPAVHAVGVGATVLVGGIGGVKDIPKQRISGDRFLAALYDNGARGFFDGVSYHPYSTPHPSVRADGSVCVYNPNPTGKDPYGMKNGWDRMLNAAPDHGRQRRQRQEDLDHRVRRTHQRQGAIRSQVLSEARAGGAAGRRFRSASQYSWVGPMCWFTYKDDVANPAVRSERRVDGPAACERFAQARVLGLSISRVHGALEVVSSSTDPSPD